MSHGSLQGPATRAVSSHVSSWLRAPASQPHARHAARLHGCDGASHAARERKKTRCNQTRGGRRTRSPPARVGFSMYAALTYIPGGGLLTGFAMRSDPFGRDDQAGTHTGKAKQNRTGERGRGERIATRRGAGEGSPTRLGPRDSPPSLSYRTMQTKSHPAARGQARASYCVRSIEVCPQAHRASSQSSMCLPAAGSAVTHTRTEPSDVNLDSV